MKAWKGVLYAAVFFLLGFAVAHRFWLVSYSPKYIKCTNAVGDTGEALSNKAADWQFKRGRWEVVKSGRVVATLDPKTYVECRLVTIP